MEYGCKYDAFEHLYRSLFKKPTDLLFMLVAYVDDSGSSPAQKVIVVAGYLGTVQLWERFNTKWQKLLDQYKIQTMRRSQLEAFQGEFKDWNNERRIQFLKRAHSIIKEYTYTGFGSAIIKEDYEESVPKDHFVRTFGGIYGWCAHACVIAIEDWRQRHKYTSSVQMVLEAGTPGHGQLDTMFRELSKDPKPNHWPIEGWSFQSKSLKPLQAADLLAYEYYRTAEKVLVQKKPVGFRKSAKDLFREHEIKFFKEWDKQAFLLWMKKWDEKSAPTP